MLIKIFCRTYPLLAVLVALPLLASCNRAPKYTTYEDCVLAEVGASQTALAAQVITDACQMKFPPSKAEIDAALAERESDYEAARVAEAAARAAAEAAANNSLK